MKYEQFGLDTNKKSLDEGTKGYRYCLWCRNDSVQTGFSMCFSNFCICTDCLKSANDQIENWKEDDGYGCFKCSKGSKEKKNYGKLFYDKAGSISICQDCIDLAKEILFKSKHIDMERKCRICGCTENNCNQCVEKTGSPCHWVEEDLCSACVEEIKESTTETLPDAYQEHVKNVLNPSSIIFTEMKFFEQLHKAAQSVDITLSIKEKNGKYTVMLLPKTSDQSKLQPIVITGTPDELDAGFFTKLGPVIQETCMQLINVDAHKKSVTDLTKKEPVKSTETPKASDKKGATKSAGKKKGAAKPEKPKAEKKEEEKPKVEEQVLFD